MTLSDLSAESGVPVATVKYYLREGLLPPGERRSATRADYGAQHVERLRLVRALVEGAGISLDGVRRILEAVAHPPASRHNFLGAAHQAISRATGPVQVQPQTREAVERLGWHDLDSEDLGQLQAALDTAARAGVVLPMERLVAYGAQLRQVARIDVEALVEDTAGASAQDVLRYVAVATVVTDGVLVALRRLAQAAESRERFGSMPSGQLEAGAGA